MIFPPYESIPEIMRGKAPGSIRPPFNFKQFEVARSDLLSENRRKRAKVMFMMAEVIHYGGVRIEGLDVVRLSGTLTESFERYPKPCLERDYLVAKLLQHAHIAETLQGSPEVHCRYDWIKNDLISLCCLYEIDPEEALSKGLLTRHLIRSGMKEVDELGTDSEDDDEQLTKDDEALIRKLVDMATTKKLGNEPDNEPVATGKPRPKSGPISVSLPRICRGCCRVCQPGSLVARRARLFFCSSRCRDQYDP